MKPFGSDAEEFPDQARTVPIGTIEVEDKRLFNVCVPP
jgi:hypothetical protein